MSASKSELPPNGRAFQYQFDLEILAIKLLKGIDIPQPAFMEVVWRRGQNNISTKVKPDVTGHEDEIVFNEKLSMISTCVLNCDTMQFAMKQSIVTVVINLAGAPKTFGSISLNLSTALNPNNQREPVVRRIEQQLTGRTKSKIVLKLSSSYVKEMVKGDQQSVGSGVGSAKFNPSNMSSYSIGYEKKRTYQFQKLDQIPSKDSYSVVSYTNTNPVRYSARREETSSIKREDSVKNEDKSQKQYNYGYYNTSSSGNGFFNRAANEYNIARNSPNIPSSGIRPSKNSQSEANRSSAGTEQNSRLLIEEQNKRSKLEAQNTKSKVQNTELKSKLSEYVRENMKLKEELKKFTDNNDSKNAEIKKENQELLNRNYVLSQEIRQLKVKFDRFYLLEKEVNGLKEENISLVREIRNYEDGMSKFRADDEQLRKQLMVYRESQARLRNQIRELQETRQDTEDAKMRENQSRIQELQRELDYAQTNLKNLNFSIRELENRNSNSQKEIKDRETKIASIKFEQAKKVENLTMAKDQQIRDLNNRLQAKNQDCNRYLLELQKARSDLQKVQDDLSQKQKGTATEVERLNILLRDSNSNNENLKREKMLIENQLKAEAYNKSKELQKVRQLESRLQQFELTKHNEIDQLRRTIENLQNQVRDLQSQRGEQGKLMQELTNNKAEIESLMKLNLQHELEIKYRNEEVERLRGLEDEYQNIKCRCQIQERNYKQVELALEKCQRQLKDKNRASILQSERVRLLTEERANNAKAFNQMKQQLENSRNVIFNGQRQVKEMDQYIFQCERRNNQLEMQVRTLEEKINSVDQEKFQKQIGTLETRIKELEKRNNEKLLTLQNLNKNLNMANKQIRELQSLSEERLKEMSHRENIINELDEKLKNLQSQRSRLEQQFSAANMEAKSANKKNNMLMEQLFVYKKKFEEEKGRSVSTVHIRNSEDFMKLRSLENEKQRLEEKVSKLEKELLNMENENVKLNIEIMKKLENYTPQC